MELGDIARIIARYGRLILVFVAVAVAVAAVTHIGDPKTYTASTRLVLDTPDPESRAESAAIADTAKALATSPSQVREAVRKARVTGRDPERISRESVSVRALGSSGIVQVSVSDTNPKAAARIANALAAEVIQTRADISKGQTQEVLTGLDRRLSGLNRRISALDRSIATLSVQAARDVSDNLSRSRVSEAERTRDFLAQQRSVVEAQRVSLLSSEALRPKSSVISLATPPTSADASRIVPDMLLAAIVALIFGLGLAGLIETVRGTVTGGGALARAFGATLLGTIRTNVASGRAFDSDPGLGIRLALAAETAGVTDVMLFSVGPRIDTEALADRLQVHSTDPIELRAVEETMLAPTAEGRPVRSTSTAYFAKSGRRLAGAGDSADALAIRPFGARSATSQDRDRTGLVIVSPTTLRKVELDQAVQLVHGTSLPLLGLIAVAPIPSPPSRLDQSVRDRLERFRKTL